APPARVAVHHDRAALGAGGRLRPGGVARVPAREPLRGWLEPVMGHNAAASAAHAETGGAGLEITLMAISVAVAFAGFGLAYLMYYRRRLRPEAFSEALGGVPYRVVLDKYYVDECYDLVLG